jgi:hypothetical protein
MVMPMEINIIGNVIEQSREQWKGDVAKIQTVGRG